ncbi:hypothetical protein K438DRAFT_1769439 [Mycena galopus ATCC 62051]|nr:hypothetical protein K438DRAFT_1769439 [Mycena galopus ATCC 62051]
MVELHDVVEDVEYLLKALSNPSAHPVFLGPLMLIEIETFSRINRASACGPRRLGSHGPVACITFENPTTLEEFDALDAAAKVYEPTRIMSSPGFLFNVLVLAQENGIVSALSVAYYRALEFTSRSNGLANLLVGIPREDETIAFLPSANLHRCVIGRERLPSTYTTPSPYTSEPRGTSQFIYWMYDVHRVLVA